MAEKVKSKIADLGNHNPDKFGGALYAAAFLREFVSAGVPWAHLDIAGPSYNEGEPFGYTHGRHRCRRTDLGGARRPHRARTTA
jgi:leucyl aminopeptidase